MYLQKSHSVQDHLVRSRKERKLSAFRDCGFCKASYQRHTSVRLRLRSSRFRRREQKNHTRGTRQSDSGYAVLASEEENRKIIPETHVSLTQSTQFLLQNKRTGKSYQRHTSVRLSLRSSRFRRREQENHTRGTRQSDSGYAVLASEEENRKIIPEAHVSLTQATQFLLQKKRTGKSYQRHTNGGRIMI